MVILPIENTVPSTAVTGQAPCGDVAATVAPLRFYDAKKTLATGAGETR